MEKERNDRVDPFADEVERVVKKIGSEELTDTDLLILTCNELVSTCTHKERGYR
jgi:hypothetical protein